jgi:DNA-binding winged helix-turn-helix (wHTH) protein/Tol biopolymer transport system component
MDETSSPDYEFAGFRLDTALQRLVSPTGEPLPLPSRAFATLRYLVERAGEVVDKAALMSTVWPTTVVAENNLNQCILALRKVLGESPGERRFILTVPGRGFKFVARVTVVPHDPAADHPGAAAPPSLNLQPRWYRSRWLWVGAGLAALALVGGTEWLWLASQHPVTAPGEYEALTDLTDSATSPVLSPDGRMLAFVRNGSWLLGTGQIWLKVLPDGEPVKLTAADGPVFAPTFSPDGTRVAYSQADLKLTSWDTWTVPVTGDASSPVKLLPNASGLTYTGAHEVLYSEFKGGIHLAIAASLEDRSQHRDIYVPSHERGMAHFSQLSPDRKSVLVAEMGSTGAFHRCRLVPFSGSSSGYEVGPDGACIAVAWSPDGRWMYFSAFVDNHAHLWRQRYPHGQPEQITFGPTDEQTVSVAPDGHSVLTSIGITHTNVWFHDANGDRALTSEGTDYSAWVSSDARRVYFLSIRGSSSESELRRLDLDSGVQQLLLPGFNITSYDISPDEQQAVFSTLRDGVMQVWLAPLDRHAPPRLLVRSGDQVAFGGGHIFFRSIGAHANYLHRIDTDGSHEIAVIEAPIVNFFSVAPDGKCVNVDQAVAGGLAAGWLVPVDPTGRWQLIGKGAIPTRWSRDGRTLYVDAALAGRPEYLNHTVAIRTGADDLPPNEAGSVVVPAGATFIPVEEDYLAPGPDPSTYVFVRSEQRRNIYRIPLH